MITRGAVAGFAVRGADAVSVLSDFHGGPLKFWERCDETSYDTSLAYAAGMAADHHQRHLTRFLML
jgi:hypothetical protein